MYDGSSPLLVIAGAGSGKTNTLAHRVAHLILGGVNPRRILLLTFSRRAAQEMTRRAERIISAAQSANHSNPGISSARQPRYDAELHWSGTFHAIANRLLRLHATGVGLDPAFTVLDRSDSADLMDLVRHELDLAKRGRRFPKKGTCLAIYSRTVNAQVTLERCLKDAFPWCEEWAEELRQLFRAYVIAKQERHVLDYDDLLVYWFHLMAEPMLAAQVRERFDHVLVDEYQDTNALQADILEGLCPGGVGLTVVGDDAQAIYGFRAATVRNILDFSQRFSEQTKIVTLAENYRSTQAILDASNALMAEAREGYSKALFSRRGSQQKPILAAVEDEIAQVDYVIEHILANREAGIDLRRQAVLFRTAHHSDALEVELGRRNIPYVKFGGLKFLEAAHVKDVLCVLRWVENPCDAVAAFRVLQLLPGVGPAVAKRAYQHVADHQYSLASLEAFKPPAAAADIWPSTHRLLGRLARPQSEWRGQLHQIRTWYQPLLEQLYEHAYVRMGDIEQLEHLSSEYPSRERFLSELTLDPPSGSGDLAGPPLLDEDYLILSTIHSAKGQEWDAVFVLHCVDGCIPSDLSTGDPEQLEEERRLLYVAMTRAKSDLHLVQPLRMFVREQRRHGDRHVYAPISRFLSESVRIHLHCVSRGRGVSDIEQPACSPVTVDVGEKLRSMW